MLEQQRVVDWRFVALPPPTPKSICWSPKPGEMLLGGNEVQWDEVMRRHPLKPHPDDGISTFTRTEIAIRAFPSPCEDTATIFKPGREPSPEPN